ncbi:hypothetical protein AVEN_267818-1 [Araneus ventricosus]|uniref:Uncharacterized protein n=1 Tax=Araneus ventricosus TaxID=182803 RepID=A0A4Y2D5K9_ARAVE|nr:hypothetical protein AVEN_267818-1 [Araneus ventricosus]
MTWYLYHQLSSIGRLKGEVPDSEENNVEVTAVEEIPVVSQQDGNCAAEWSRCESLIRHCVQFPLSTFFPSSGGTFFKASRGLGSHPKIARILNYYSTGIGHSLLKILGRAKDCHSSKTTFASYVLKWRFPCT